MSTFEDLVAEGEAVPNAIIVEAAVADAEATGLEVVDLRQEALRVGFYDIAAVVHFLRKVLGTVRGFTVDAYRGRPAALHDFTERHGPFVASARRLLIEARRKRSGGPQRHPGSGVPVSGQHP